MVAGSLPMRPWWNAAVAAAGSEVQCIIERSDGLPLESSIMTLIASPWLDNLLLKLRIATN